MADAWSHEALLHHVETVIAQVDRRHSEALKAHAELDATNHDCTQADLAQAKREAELGFQAVRDADYLRKAEYNRAHEALVAEVKRFSELVLAGESRSRGRGDVWGWIVGAVGLIATIATIAYYATR